MSSTQHRESELTIMTTDAPARPLRVLLAEDGPANRKLAAYLLGKLKCETTFATNGAEALDEMRRAAFDVVLMDIEMPVMDGLTALRAIKGDGAMCATPVVALTAHNSDEDRDRWLRAGFDGFLPKPLRKEQLEQALATVRPQTRENEVAELAENTADSSSNSDSNTNSSVESFSAASPFDRRHALERVCGDEEFLRDMMELFLASYVGMLVEVNRRVESADLDDLADAAHALKGAVATLTQGECYEAARAAEYAGRDHDRPTARHAVARLNMLMPTLVDALRDDLAARPVSTPVA